MKKMMNTKLLPLVLTVVCAATVAMVVGGCMTSARSADMATSESNRNEADGVSSSFASDSVGPNRAGAILWSQNCMRCHNLRNPNEKSDREWDTIMLHMRVRANLTAEEHRLILAFLQSAN